MAGEPTAKEKRFDWFEPFQNAQTMRCLTIDGKLAL
jgi:hypothetical protein